MDDLVPERAAVVIPTLKLDERFLLPIVFVKQMLVVVYVLKVDLSRLAMYNIYSAVVTTIYYKCTIKDARKAINEFRCVTLGSL